MFVCNRCAARRKSRASSVVCLVCKKGELILEGGEGSAGSVGGVGGVGVGVGGGMPLEVGVRRASGVAGMDLGQVTVVLQPGEFSASDFT